MITGRDVADLTLAPTPDTARDVASIPDEIPLVAKLHDEHDGTVAMLASGTRIPVPMTDGNRFLVQLSGTNLESGNLFVDKARVTHCRDLVQR